MVTMRVVSFYSHWQLSDLRLRDYSGLILTMRSVSGGMGLSPGFLTSGTTQDLVCSSFNLPRTEQGWGRHVHDYF